MPMPEARIPTKNLLKIKLALRNDMKVFDYTAIMERLMNVSWCKYSHPTVSLTGLWANLKPSYALQEPCNHKDTHLKLYK